MKNYKRSICSTCRHAPYCSLTTNMSNIWSCSEYAHYLDKEKEPVFMVSLEMVSKRSTCVGHSKKNEQKELLLN